GHFFPGLVPVFLAAFALVRLRGGHRPAAAAPAPAPIRGRGTKIALAVLDLSAGILVAAYFWAAARPGLQVRAVLMRSPGRIFVWLTIVVLPRLTLAFPSRFRSRNLADYFRRVRLDRTAVLLVVLGGAGVVYALGANTPFFGFLFQTIRDVVG